MYVLLCNNVHVTLLMYELLCHAWGGGWGGVGNNVHVTLLMYALLRLPWVHIQQRVTMDMACKCLTLLTHTWDCPNRVGPLPPKLSCPYLARFGWFSKISHVLMRY